jgi:hypothetical protein
MSVPRVVYIVAGREYASQGAAKAALSSILGYEVTSINTYDVTTNQDAADSRHVFMIWADPRQLTADDTQEVAVVPSRCPR